MANCGVKTCFGFSPFRRRQQAASNRRFCMTWINRMVNKQVEKRIAEQHSASLLTLQALREEIMAELQEQLTELVAEEARQRYQDYTDLDQELRATPQGPWKREEEYEEETEEDEDETSLDPEILSFTSGEILCTTISISVRKPPKRERDERWYISSHASSNGDPSDGETTEVFNDADTSAQPAKREQQENQHISTDAATVADTSQLVKESEEGISKNPFLAGTSFMTEQPRCEEERVQVDRAREEGASLTERQWKEWMDKQEMRTTHIKANPGPQNTESQGRAAPPVSEKQTKQSVKRVGTVKKMKTYLSHLFNPDRFYKWERLDEED